MAGSGYFDGVIWRIGSGAWTYGDTATGDADHTGELQFAINACDVWYGGGGSCYTFNSGTGYAITLSVEGADDSPVAAFDVTAGTGPGAYHFASTSTDGDSDISTTHWDFGDGTSGDGTTADHTYATHGPFTAKMAVTDDVGHSDSITKVVDGQLKISQVVTTPSTLIAGDDATLDVTLRDDSSFPATDVAPALSNITPTGGLQIIDGPTPASASIAAGDTTTFSYTVRAPNAGTVSLNVDAAGTGGGPISAGQVSRNLDVQASKLAAQLTFDPASPRTGKHFKSTLTVTNNGTAVLDNVQPGPLTFSPSTGVTVASSTPAAVASLQPGASTAFDYDVVVDSAGDYDVSAHPHATDHDTNLQVDGTVTKQAKVADNVLTVTTTGDQQEAEADRGDGACDVDPATPGDQCTLRAAIEEANAATGAQTIDFNIDGGGIPTITPDSPLPAITGTTTIDGTTQAAHFVEINGSNAGGGPGFALTGDGATLRGLIVNRFTGDGIDVGGAGRNHLVSNRIGTDSSGSSALPNSGAQVDVSSGESNVIGGPNGVTPGGACTGDCNLVAVGSGGILVDGGSRTSVVGNMVGIDVSGRHLLADRSTGAGIAITGTNEGTQIGGDHPSDRNVIAGAHAGINIGSGDQPTVTGNFIGTDTSGQAALGNDIGVLVNQGRGSPDMVIGGATATAGEGAGNLIAGNDGGTATGGVVCQTECQVNGNLIGLAVDGTTALPNRTGVIINGGGGVGAPDAPNVVSGNLGDGIDLTNPAGATRAGSFGPTKVQHTFVGTDREGKTAVGNGGTGIAANGVVDIGGGDAHPVLAFFHLPPAGNVVSGNGHDGIVVTDPGLSDGARFVDAIVSGNIVGLDAAGDQSLPNGRRGIAASTEAASSDERLAAQVTISGNLVSANGATGIQLSGPPAVLSFGEAPSGGAHDHRFVISGNMVGVDRFGSSARPNSGLGIDVTGLADVQIGQVQVTQVIGQCIGGCNQVSANRDGGIRLRSTYGAVWSNLIGLGAGPDRAPLGALGNGGPGVHIEGDDNVVGVPVVGLGGGNVIAYNTGPGILVTATSDAKSVRNTLRQNLIYANTGIPIDLNGDGPTKNQPNKLTGTGDGPNDLLNKPTLHAAAQIGNRVVIAGALSHLGDWGKLGTYTIDIYAGPCPQLSPFASTYVGQATTSVLQNGAFAFVYDQPLPAGTRLSVTATAPNAILTNTADTSELSADCAAVQPGAFVIHHLDAGGTELQVSDNGPFAVGDTVVINPGGANEETATISGFGSLIFAQPLTFAHETDELVVLKQHATPAPISPSPTSGPALARTGRNLINWLLTAMILISSGTVLMLLQPATASNSPRHCKRQPRRTRRRAARGRHGRGRWGTSSWVR